MIISSFDWLMEKQFCFRHWSIFHTSSVFSKLFIDFTHLRNLWNLFPVLTRDGDVEHTCAPEPSPEIKAETAIRDDFASRKARAYKKASSPRQKFVHFGPVTEIDQQTWKRLSIGRAGPKEDAEEVISHSRKIQTYSASPALAAMSSLQEDHRLNPQNDCRYFLPLHVQGDLHGNHCCF